MDAAAIKPGLPTLHHLNNSQSQRVVWLLEELGIEYNLVKHKRGDCGAAEGRAPPDMAKIHQLGKAPILVTEEGRVVVETSVVITYLLQTYDPTQEFAAPDFLRDEELTSFAASSLGPVAAIQLFVDLLVENTPWPIVYLTRAIKSQVQKTYTTAEFVRSMKYLESELGDKEWFNGKHLGKSDFMISWPLDNCAQMGWVDFERDYPKLGAWRERVLEREAWKRGIEKGNGYNLKSIQ